MAAKLNRYVLIGFVMLAAALVIPIVIGEFPSAPGKPGFGRIPAIDLSREPARFWSFWRGLAFTPFVFVVMWLLTRAKGHEASQQGTDKKDDAILRSRWIIEPLWVRVLD